MAFRLMTANNKGGVGRTSQAIGLAYAVAATGRRVLYVSMDPQGDGDRRLGLDGARKRQLIAEGNLGIAGVLDPNRTGDDKVRMADVVVPCGWEDPTAANIDIVPSLAMFDLEQRGKEAHHLGAITRLRRALREFDDSSYHLVIIDTGPTAGHLFELALVATDWLVLVVLPEVDGVAGAKRVITYIRDMSDLLPERAEPLRIVGWLANNHDGSGDHRHYDSMAGDGFRDPWTSQPIPQWMTVRHKPSWASAMGRGEPPSLITHTATRGVILRTYKNHAQRLIEAGI